MTKKSIKNYVLRWTDPAGLTNGAARISLYSAGVPNSTRTIEIRRSLWWKKNNYNFDVLYLHGGEALGSEAGLSMDATIKCVQVWLYRQGWV